MAIEDVARLRDGLGAAPPVGVPQAFLEPVADPVGDLLARYARTHGPFLPATRPAGSGWAWPSWSRPWPGWRRPAGSCRASSARRVGPRVARRRGAARLRRRPWPRSAARSSPSPPRPWPGSSRAQGVGPAGPRSADLDALFRVVEQLQGAAVPASALERQVLAARLPGYHPGLLDQLCASGEVVWAGAGALGSDDGWVGLYLAEGAPLLLPEPLPVELSPLAAQVRDDLATNGAMFFRQLSDSVARPTTASCSWPSGSWSGPATSPTTPWPPSAPWSPAAPAPTTRRRAPTRRYGRRGPTMPTRTGPSPPRAAGASFRPPPRPTRPGGCMRWRSSCWTGTGC